MPAKRRSERLLLLGVGLFLAAAAAVYYILQHAQDWNLQVETDRILLAVLSIVMALLALSLLFLLLRNLIKLLVERRRNVLGSRFRTKLVFIFLVIVLIPSVVLFYAAVRLIAQVNESLLTAPLEEIVDDSRDLMGTYLRTVREDCALFSARIAAEISERRLLDADRTAELALRAKTWLAEDGLDFVALYRSSRSDPVFSLRSPSLKTSRGLSEAQIVGSSEEFLREAIEEEQPSHRLDLLDNKKVQRASAIVPLESWASREVIGAVVVGRFIAPETAQKTERIKGAYLDYRRALDQRPNLKRVYILLFGTLTLLVCFAASWTGFYLARQITVPIQALAEGTQAISAGNLEYRVEARAGDEIGFLIDSFNRMTEELRSNRAAIESSRQQLEAHNLQREERRQYIERLLENVPAGVISLDARGTITTMNRAAYRILGLSPDRPCSGMPAGEALRGEALSPLAHEIEDLPEGEIVSQVREFQLEIEGRPVNLAANLSARRDAGGRFQGALIVIEDLTPVIRAQKTAAWREVARRIAHEIKNPLTPIQLSAQRILKKYSEGAEDYPRIVEEGVNTIVSEVATLERLVDEFSRFARMPAVSPVPTDPNAVVESALSLYDGIHIGVALRKDLEASPPLVLLDADQMKRALINLIDNAVAALEGQGTITLSTRSILEQKLLRIEVADDGPGISPEDKERLFVPYFSTKRRGTGLGLAIVNRIVSDHNGFIRVEDNRPKGTKFVIDLPA